MKLKRYFVGIFTAVMFFSLTACNSSNIDLYINAQAGDVYKYHTVSSIVSSSDIMGNTIAQKQDTTTDFIINIDSVDSDGSVTANYLYDYICFETDTNGTKQTYDSNDTSEESVMYKNIIGKGFSTKITKYGEVTEVSGVDETLNTLIDSAYPGLDDDATRESLKTSFSSTFGDSAVKALVQQSTNIFPKTPIKKGDSWEISNTINTIVEINTTTTYTLDSINDNIANLSMKSEFITDKSEIHDYAGTGMEMTVDMTGNTTGTITIDTTNGFLSTGNLKQELSGTMSVTVPSIEGSEEEKVDIPMASTTTVTYSTTKQ